MSQSNFTCILVAALVITQVLYGVALVAGLIKDVWLAFLPTIIIAAIVMFRYFVIMIKVIIIAIKSVNRNEAE